MDPIIISSDDDLPQPEYRPVLPSPSVQAPSPTHVAVSALLKRKRTPLDLDLGSSTPPPPLIDVVPPVASSIPIPRSQATRFNLQGKKFFLTFPKCSASVDQVLAQCATLPQLSWAVVATEQHKDGSPHLHVVLVYSEKQRLKGLPGLAVFDGLVSQHGNYKTIKNSKLDLLRTLQYVKKDGNFKSIGIDLEEFMRGLSSSKTVNSGVWIQAADKLRAGISLTELHEWNPSFVALNLQKVQQYQKWLVRNTQEVPTSVLIRVHQDIPTSAGIQLTTWMNLNLVLGKTTGRSPRQKQLWLCGPPGIGKTRIRAHLATYLRIYIVPNDEDFYDDWEDNLYDLAVFDEFKGQKTIQWMNSWLDGQPKPLRKKGSQYTKHQNVATVILSNFTPQQCYHKAFNQHASQLAPLLDRLEVVQWDTQNIDIEYISETACSDYEKSECAAGRFDQFLDPIDSGHSD